MSAFVDAIGRIRGAARLVDAVKLRRSLLAPPPSPPPNAVAPDSRGFANTLRLDEDGVRSLEAKLPYASGAPLAGRLALGDSCYAAVRLGGEGRAWEVLAMMWVAANRPVYVYELDREVVVPRGVAWVYEAFTFPRARSQGLAKRLLNRIVRDLAHEARAAGSPGAPRGLEAWVSRGNAPSLKVFEGQGFEAYGRWQLVALGSARVLRGDPTLGPPAPGAESAGSAGARSGGGADG